MDHSPRPKSRSFMSDRQMARAAVDGRLLSFIQQPRPAGEQHDLSVSGFLVGMDDYHWLIVPEDCPAPGSEDLPVILVHKSCPFVMISPGVLLADYSEPLRAGVAKIGERFWEHCKQTHLGHTATTPQEKQ